MKPIQRVTDLLEEHGDTYNDCPGCSICKEIESLRSQLDRPPAEKFKKLLNKGLDLKRSEILFLLDNGVQKLEIRKAMKLSADIDEKEMTQAEFAEMIENLNLKKEHLKMKMTHEEYKDMKAQGMTDSSIATKYGIKGPTLAYYKKKWNGKPEPKILREKEVMGKIESSQKEAKLEKEKSELHAAADDLEQELSLIKSELLVYKKRYEESQLEIGDWREKAHSYARDNELMNETNKELRFLADQHREENKALRTALKLVL
ncbi:MAG: hypothetical protein ACI35R_04340 [Bacillus sp. (in: firmicutes)]|uniref:hypothetical protein n=1 Tax=Bacillus testis TaxID=1622072 RepID=UPI00067F6034|nr:hypothetical protein [Bacillus testis]